MDYNSKILATLGEVADPEASPINRTNVYEAIYTITGRTINCPPEMASVGVSTDTCAETLKFRIPRYFDGVDLSQHIGKILFVNAAGESDEKIIENAEITGSVINFEWCLDGGVTKAAGTVNFAIRFETIDTLNEEIVYRWTSLPCTLKVEQGINFTDEKIIENYPSVLEQWLQEMNDLKVQVESGLGGTSGATEDAANAANSANTAAGEANTAAQKANTEANNAKVAAASASQATTTANNAANSANEAASGANTAAGNANTAASDANRAAGAAEGATNNANTAAANANNAATAATTAATAASDAAQAALAAIPTKGVDYYTEAEKTSLKAEIKDELLNEIEANLDEILG